MKYFAKGNLSSLPLVLFLLLFGLKVSFYYSNIDDPFCDLLNIFQNQLETVLKIFRYSMQTPVYEESLTELTEIYRNFSFLGYPNVSGLDPQQVQVDLSYATSCKKLYQRYKAYG